MTNQELADIEARQNAAMTPGRFTFEWAITEKDILKLIQAVREANGQLSDLKKAVKELLFLKECGTFKEAEVRERVKDLLAGIAEVEGTPSIHPNCYYFNVEHDNFYCNHCNMGQGTNRFSDIKHNHRPDCMIHGAERPVKR